MQARAKRPHAIALLRREDAVNRALHRLLLFRRRGGNGIYPNGVMSFSPRVARNELPWGIESN
jgi:hypothetical protein